MDLSTTYLGLNLKNPLVPSSSPLMRHLDNLKRMEDAGAAAVILPSLFEEQINQESHTLDAYLTQGIESYSEALSSQGLIGRSQTRARPCQLSQTRPSYPGPSITIASAPSTPPAMRVGSR